MKTVRFGIIGCGLMGREFAGACALQEDDTFITNLEGSFSNVVGLPLELFERMLRDLLAAQLLSQIKP